MVFNRTLLMNKSFPFVLAFVSVPENCSPSCSWAAVLEQCQDQGNAMAVGCL